MNFRIGSVLAALALAFSMTAVALAQADDDSAVDTSVAAPSADQPSAPPTLFLTLVNPVDQDVEVPLETARLTIRGATLPGAVVSIDGDLIDTDDQGSFVGVTALDEGANQILIVASDDQGNQVNTNIFITRGE